MTYPKTVAPQHFSGELTAKTLNCCLGLHRMEIELADDDGGKHVAYLAYGRGDAAGQYAQHQYDSLTIGQWYHSSATMVRRTFGLTEWAGHVPPLQPCHRRHRAGQMAATTSNASAGVAA